jgi:hypothetical protein
MLQHASSAASLKNETSPWKLEIFDFLPRLQRGILRFHSGNNIVNRKFIHLSSGYHDKKSVSHIMRALRLSLPKSIVAVTAGRTPNEPGAASDDGKLEEQLQATVQHCADIGGLDHAT